MSVIGSNVLAGASGGAGAAGFAIERSLRFNPTDTPWLYFDPSGHGNRKTFTFSFWVKRSGFGTEQLIHYVRSGPGNTGKIFFDTSDRLTVLSEIGSSNNCEKVTSQVFRDPSAWYHIVVKYDAANTNCDIYVNGEEVENFDTNNEPSNVDSYFGGDFQHYLGAYDGSSVVDGYLAEVQMVNAQALDATSFGAPDNNGVWQPKEFAGTYGTNGFHLDFADNSSAAALGYDAAGSNDWTVNNLAVIGNGNWIRATSLTAGTFYTGRGIIPNIYNGLIANNGSPENQFLEFGSFPATLTFNPAITSSSGNVKMHIASYYGPSSYDVTINGTTTLTLNNVPGNGSTPTLYDLGVTSLSSITFPTGGSTAMRVFGIVANGVLLADYSNPGNDSLVDTPTNGATASDTGLGNQITGNYATWNPLSNGTNAATNGNLELPNTSGSVNRCNATIAVSSGKWYFEATLLTAGTNTTVGIAASEITNLYPGQDALSYAYTFEQGTKINSNSQPSYGSTLGAGDVFQVAMDLNNNKLYFGKNGTWMSSSNPETGANPVYTLSAGTYRPIARPYGGGSIAANFGQRAFAYTAPSGYKSLNSANLSPTIADGRKYFDTKLWAGNSTYPRSITGLNFSPDLIWLKNRTSAYDHVLMDAIRGTGTTKWLSSNLTDAEGVDYANANVTSLDANGFTIASTSGTDILNQSGTATVGWAWDAGANSDKTYTVTVSGGDFYIDGAQQPTLTLAEGSTYKFDQSDSSNATHPLRFSTTSDGTHGGGSEYTTGVTTAGTPGSAGAYTQIVIAASAPTLYAYCTNHSGMGFQVNTSDTGGATNLDGSIASQVKANQSAGFSIVTYTGGAANSTVGHGLGANPYLIICKSRNQSSAGWDVYHRSLGKDKFLILNQTYAEGVYSNHWGTSEPNSTVFGVSQVNYFNNHGNMVAYCFAPVEGYSSIGSYTGNGSADGPFVSLSFRPAWIMIKCTNNSTNAHWIIMDTKRDTYNVVGNRLMANQDWEENNSAFGPNTIGSMLDILSNGFKIRTTSTTGINYDGDTYIYLAFAENPFQANGGLAR